MKSDLVGSSQDTITSAAIAESSVKIIPEGATLVVVRSGILARTVPVALAACELTVNQDLKALIPGTQIESRYLNYFLKSAESYLLSRVTRGATVHKLDSDVLKTLPIPVPTKEEQKRIVAILDEAFSGIAMAVANTEKNLASARELFESYLNTVFGKRDEGWIKYKLEDIVVEGCSLSYGIVQPGIELDEGLSVVRPTDLSEKIIRLNNLKRIDPARAKAYTRTTLHGGDLLLCVRGSTGVVSIASNELKGANVTRGIVPIRLDPSLVGQEFGYYLFSAPSVQEQIAEKTYGAALMQINIRDVRKICVYVPSRQKQNELLGVLDGLSAETSRLEFIYQQKLTYLAELKQSLLQKAFSGELAAVQEVPNATLKEEEVA
jgi:type I restriction enzyme S subunit